jgi:NADPH-dependent glutamate synthase beta subunit-like oxidoreductase
LLQQALVSIGYKGVAIDGTEPWFDQSRGTLRNTHGLVDPPTDELGGLYTAGWLKRGPSGIIGTNIPDAKDTVASMLHDIAALSPKGPSDSQSHQLEVLLKERGVEYVDWDGYQRIDVAESSSQRKRHADQPREKITSRQELLDVARGTPL